MKTTATPEKTFGTKENKSSEIGHDYKTLRYTFVYFLTAIAKV